MKTNKPTLLILAAGLGSRYGSLKQIDKIGPSGERIIDYSVYDAIKAGFGKVVYVIRKSFEEEFKEVIIDVLPTEIETDYVFQELDSLASDIKTNPDRTKPWGTGHALLTASSAIENSFAVINADDFYGADSFKLAYNFLISVDDEPSEHALIGYKLINTMSDYGSVSRGVCEVDEDNFMNSIIERTEIIKNEGKILFKDEQSNVKELSGSEIVSMNMFAFKNSIFNRYQKSFDNFLKKNGNDLKREFYLPSVVDELIKSKLAKVKVIETTEQWFGLTYKEDKEMVKTRISNLVKQGKYPTKLW
ncbi:MAG: nucleotidyltransferase [Ignavibacteriales bacterium CG18_big_fil_WC_8_21_14_2_50_31_20]|nr:MAG: nucleotidyltransferase [Ignavibacteriales bacterium CG18_big_fil_WC_8_21_14_2_50_31_20]